MFLKILKYNMQINNITKIFFLCLVNNEDRVNNTFKNIDYLNKNFNINDKIKINYTAPLNIVDDEDIIKSLYKYFNHNDISKGQHIINSFSCFFNHYNIISEAYFLNYDYILVFEDDINIFDFNKFTLLLNNIPDDADFIQFVVDVNTKKSITAYYNNYYSKVNKLISYTTACMFLSKKMIKYVYNYYFNSKCTYADIYQYTEQEFLKKCNVYIPKYETCDTFKFKSCITY